MPTSFGKFVLVGCLGCCTLTAVAPAADLFQIDPTNRPAIGGKEIDWIDGDFVIRNDKIIAVVANPVEGRDANMTVRDAGAGLIDLTRRDGMSDQLSAFYPAASRFLFEDASAVETGDVDGGVFWQCTSSSVRNGSGGNATVRYELRDGDDFVTVTTTLRGEDTAADGVRADRTFQFGTLSVDDQNVAFFRDEFFRQCYGITGQGLGNGMMQWDKERMRRVTYPPAAGEDPGNDDNTIRWTVRLYPAANLVDLVGIVRGSAPQTIQLDGLVGDQPRPTLTILSADADQLASLTPELQTKIHFPENGNTSLHLSPGKYQVRAEAIGHQAVITELTVGPSAADHTIEFSAATSIVASTRDSDGNPSPAKWTFYGIDGTANPTFGPDSADGSVENCVYTVDGNFTRSIPAGRYECIISRGPEFDAEIQTIQVADGQQTTVDVTLNRVINTDGWVSAELHSHSTPSGDNTSSQRGRVENLVCEHIEFGPCTEHQRIESYEDFLGELGAMDLMATCSGMELTGGPLPLNHQNAFPLKWTPHAQSGGGPRTDTNPITQIQRLAMWDDESDKVIQINHPNLNQMARDKDKDGTEDGGFASMFQFADVIEVHPPEAIFDDPEEITPDDLRDNRILQWMRLISEGQRIPGVVNTDAHYNHHGSGWLRNWVASSTDDPAQIDIDEMTANLEAGRAIMSTGPFMTVQLHAKELDRPAQIGDEVTLSDGNAELAVQIQCPNWLDVTRVEVFVGTRRVDELTRRRQTHPDAFADGVIKFDQRLPLSIDGDTFIVVAAIGEQRELGRVYGDNFGKQPPVVISNPIYVRR
ncbi:CehA/McbA family metallohydrolase [Crateriforma conspicua]|uniref:CehA/McbA family metallohydrolase n=1 Tax=Crateriforma conspicua TaxID=2527996 RepID=UPI0011892F5D|nr:CehA/McbA family metallohydrolase [Crateriforma conspicua]QDV65102.1 hypothetical protein Mal65_42710 [Crateriforma conspicua]